MKLHVHTNNIQYCLILVNPSYIRLFVQEVMTNPGARLEEREREMRREERKRRNIYLQNDLLLHKGYKYYWTLQEKFH